MTGDLGRERKGPCRQPLLPVRAREPHATLFDARPPLQPAPPLLSSRCLERLRPVGFRV